MEKVMQIRNGTTGHGRHAKPMEGDMKENVIGMPHSAKSSHAPFEAVEMIRCYSLPVAKQDVFDQQVKARALALEGSPVKSKYDMNWIHTNAIAARQIPSSCSWERIFLNDDDEDEMNLHTTLPTSSEGQEASNDASEFSALTKLLANHKRSSYSRCQRQHIPPRTFLTPPPRTSYAPDYTFPMVTNKSLPPSPSRKMDWIRRGSDSGTSLHSHSNEGLSSSSEPSETASSIVITPSGSPAPPPFGLGRMSPKYNNSTQGRCASRPPHTCHPLSSGNDLEPVNFTKGLESQYDVPSAHAISYK